MCPDGTRCDKNADCFHVGYDRYKCKCRVGFAGDGFVCGADSDLDGWPDYDLGCDDRRCRKVKIVLLLNLYPSRNTFDLKLSHNFNKLNLNSVVA